MDDPVELLKICTKVVSDAASSRQLQQWCDGKSKVYKYFFSRAVEATNSEAPDTLLRQALNSALGEYRAVDVEFIRLATKGNHKAVTRTSKLPNGGGGSRGGSRGSEISTPGSEFGDDDGGGGSLSRPSSSTTIQPDSKKASSSSSTTKRPSSRGIPSNKNNGRNGISSSSQSTRTKVMKEGDGSNKEGNGSGAGVVENNSMRTLRLLEEKLMKGSQKSFQGFDIDDDPFGDDDD